MRYLITLIKLFLLLLVLTALGLGIMFLIMRSPMPTSGARGQDANLMAKSMQEAVQRSQWANTKAIKWSLLNRSYLWDLDRGLVRARLDGYEVLFDVKQKRHAVKKGKTKIDDAEAEDIALRAYNMWLLDRFILEPTQSFFDEGVKRFLIDPDTPNESLFVHYAEGGETPGDSFQWFLRSNGLPEGVRVWSKKLPIEGMMISFKHWKTLKTGLKISTYRTLGPLTVDIKVKADISLLRLVGRVDPFLEIEPDPFDPTPASQPSTYGIETSNLF